MRPLLDGDSLSYHLAQRRIVGAGALALDDRNALLVVSAGIRALRKRRSMPSSGPFALPWSGFGALALLGFRIAAWTREAFAAPPLAADALAAATVTAYPLAIQAGTLQNDVWLAAFWLEALWLMRRCAADARGDASARRNRA